MNIRTMMTSFPAAVRSPVIPMLNPTVPRADAASKESFRKPSGSVTHRTNKPAIKTLRYNVALATATWMRNVGTRRPQNRTAVRPRN